jgi:sec-independent protein translocase protein TatA
MSLGPAEILVVLVVALVLFGPKRLPEVSRQVGGALRELRKIQDTVQSEMRSVIDDHVGPVHQMTTHEPPLADQLPPELTAGEPDLGDEQSQPPPIGASERPASERPDIDGLSGGSFS